MKILIIGAEAATYTLAKLLKGEHNEVFTTPLNSALNDFSTNLDVNVDDTEELLYFAKENNIDLTVALSEKAIAQGIAEIFNHAGLTIFAPDLEAQKMVASKSHGKKFMYKNKIATPRFAIFDKESLALEYLRNLKLPILISADAHNNDEYRVLCTNFTQAKNQIKKAFYAGCKKIIIEEQLEGKEFSAYVLTDGYNAVLLPINRIYKNCQDGNAGYIGAGYGAYAPYDTIDKKYEHQILTQIFNPALQSLNREENPYIGILGAHIILDKHGKLSTLEFYSSLKDPDAQTIFSLVKENWANLFNACITGSLSDEYKTLKTSEDYCVSLVLSSTLNPYSFNASTIKGIENVQNAQIAYFNTFKNEQDTFCVNSHRVLTVTSCAPTLSRAKELAYENASEIDFDSKKVRSDIAKLLIIES